MINLEKLKEQEFAVKTRVIKGEELYLVYPTKIGVKWGAENMIYRSSMWTRDGKPVSLGFKKFFNLGEAPHICADPVSLEKCTVVEKLDGTCLIVSKHKGHEIVRTRGTVDFAEQANADELQLLKDFYPMAFDNPQINSEQYTFLYEFTTPTNVIVLDYGAIPDIRLVGVVQHLDYSYLPQHELDQIAREYKLKRPKTATYSDLYKLTDEMKTVLGIEGYCIYYHNDQDIKKVKSDDYLAKHRFKSDYSVERVIDLYLQQGRPHYIDFMAYLQDELDFECMLRASADASKICDAMVTVNRITTHMEQFVRGFDGKERSGRKEAALAITQAYGNTNRAGFAFKLLDGGTLDNDDMKKLLFQCLN